MAYRSGTGLYRIQALLNTSAKVIAQSRLPQRLPHVSPNLFAEQGNLAPAWHLARLERLVHHPSGGPSAIPALSGSAQTLGVTSGAGTCRHTGKTHRPDVRVRALVQQASSLTGVVVHVASVPLGRSQSRSGLSHAFNKTGLASHEVFRQHWHWARVCAHCSSRSMLSERSGTAGSTLRAACYGGFPFLMVRYLWGKRGKPTTR